MAPFESLGAVSYLSFIVTMDVSCIVSEIKRDIGRKLRFFNLHTPLHSTPPLSVFVGIIINIPFGKEKLEWSGYPMVK